MYLLGIGVLSRDIGKTTPSTSRLIWAATPLIPTPSSVIISYYQHFCFVCVEFLVDECATDAHNCDPLATCTDTRFSFDCTCKAGYEGTGAVGHCIGEWTRHGQCVGRWSSWLLRQSGHHISLYPVCTQWQNPELVC